MAEAWPARWTVADGVAHLNHQSRVLAAALRAGDADGAEAAAAGLARLRAPCAVRPTARGLAAGEAAADPPAGAPFGGASEPGQAAAEAPKLAAVDPPVDAPSGEASVPAAQGPADESAPSAAASSAQPAAPAWYAVGDHVEYHSQTHQRWVPAVVLAVDVREGTYKLNIHPAAVREKVQAATTASGMPRRREEAPRAPRRQVTKALSGVDDRSSLEPIASEETSTTPSRRLEPGEAAEYHSTTFGGWVPAVVHDYDAETGSYVLDIQPMAFPSNVRPAAKARNPETGPDAVVPPPPAGHPAPAPRPEVNRPAKAGDATGPGADAEGHPWATEGRHLQGHQFLFDGTCSPPAAQLRHCVAAAAAHRQPAGLRAALGADAASVQPAAGSRPMPETRLCNLCGAEQAAAAFSGPPSCDHRFCNRCLRRYVAVADFVRAAVPCPRAKVGCAAHLSPEQVRAAVGEKLWAQRYTQVDEEAARALQEEFVRELAAEEDEPPAFECPLCFDRGARDGAIELDCDHRFCVVCFRSYLESRISEAQVADDELVCPIPQCRAAITVEQVEGATSGTPLWLKFLEFRMSIWRPSSGDGVIVACPKPDCGKFVVPANMDAVQCPVCRREFCPKCGAERHPGISCQDFRAWQGENANIDQHFEELMAQEQWKRCPKCGAPSARESGCNFMQCRSEICRKRTYWCYICGLQMPKEEHYKHFPRGPYEDECRTQAETPAPASAASAPGAASAPDEQRRFLASRGAEGPALAPRLVGARPAAGGAAAGGAAGGAASRAANDAAAPLADALQATGDALQGGLGALRGWLGLEAAGARVA